MTDHVQGLIVATKALLEYNRQHVRSNHRVIANVKEAIAAVEAQRVTDAAMAIRLINLSERERPI